MNDRDNKQNLDRRPSVAPSDSEMGQQAGGPLLTRRRLIYGAVGVGALAAIGAGVVALNANSQDDEIVYLDAPEESLVTLNDMNVLDSQEGKLSEVGNFDLPYGSLVWVNDDSFAACLLPTDKGSPLTQVGLLALGSGTLTTVLEEAIGRANGFEIYDVRATSKGLIWTEINVFDSAWRIYSARLADGKPASVQLHEEGGSEYEAPTLGAVGDRGFWQVLPKLPNDNGLTSRLMKATFGSSDSTTVYESERRMGTPPYSTTDSIVITPRADSSTVYYQLTNIDAQSDEVLDTLTLPASMRPLEAGYGRNGFMFSFADIYNYGGAISNLGTYTPMKKPSGSYDQAKWFGFARTPTAPPAWCGKLLIVKSNYSVCGVDLDAGEYFTIDVDNGADTYGEYLASTGERKQFVTFTNIDYKPVGSDPVKTCRVKVWTTV